MDDIVDDKNGHNVVNDSFAHKPDGLLVACGTGMTCYLHGFIAPGTLHFTLSIGTRHIGESRGTGHERHLPPLGLISFIFMRLSANILPNNSFMPLPLGLAPPDGFFSGITLSSWCRCFALHTLLNMSSLDNQRPSSIFIFLEVTNHCATWVTSETSYLLSRQIILYISLCAKYFTALLVAGRLNCTWATKPCIVTDHSTLSSSLLKTSYSIHFIMIIPVSNLTWM